jgi:malate dehydrogenase (oxaloacetate-decarboxylating)
MSYAYRIDTVLRVRTRHRPGQLASLAATVADEGALIGEIVTLRREGEASVRDITVETEDDAQTERVVAALRRTDGVEVLDVVDQVFERHKGGKIHCGSRAKIAQLSDLRYIYTPGVARVARVIEGDPQRALTLTGLGNSVGIFTNGTRVLGLGDIGPVAALPVMEGKAVLYDQFVGLSAVPILVDTTDANEFIETVMRVSRSFGAIHLEDIRVPECFAIEAELDRRLDKPVMHDDQHGTATVALAGILNACRLVGLDLKGAKMGQVGLGAAGSAIAKLALAYGVGEVMVTDPNEQAVLTLVARGARPADFASILRDADIVVMTTGKPGLVESQRLKKGQVIFALSNPLPEITPEKARQAGASFAADGQSVNNALAFPGLFKGALEARSRAITHEMMIAAAEAIADHAVRGEVVPSPLMPEVHRAVTRAVAEKARAQGLSATMRL